MAMTDIPKQIGMTDTLTMRHQETEIIHMTGGGPLVADRRQIMIVAPGALRYPLIRRLLAVIHLDPMQTTPQLVKEGPYAWNLPIAHDGQLVRISLETGGSLGLRIATARGHVTLVLPQLHALKANNFREGNTILSLRAYGKQVCPAKLAQEAFGFNEAEAAGYLATRLAEISAFDWAALELSPSYGCALIALSKSPPHEWVCQLDNAATTREQR